MPIWLSDGLAVAMLTVAAYCASRLIVARLTHRSTDYSIDAVHTAMGVAMAGMLTARLVSTTTWVVVFAMAAGWFGYRMVRGLVGVPGGAVGPHLRHLVTSGAMVYMLVAAPAAASASPSGAVANQGMSAARTPGVQFPTVALLLVAFMVGYTVMVTDRTSRKAQEPQAAEHIIAPRSVACCQVAMNLTMGYMLLTMP